MSERVYNTFDDVVPEPPDPTVPKSIFWDSVVNSDTDNIILALSKPGQSKTVLIDSARDVGDTVKIRGRTNDVGFVIHHEHGIDNYYIEFVTLAGDAYATSASYVNLLETIIKAK
jgi:hypothetical protein